MSGRFLNGEVAAGRKPALRLLRLFLVFSAFAWGVCIVGVFASWPQGNAIAQGMGAKPIAYDPMLDYWLRMIGGAGILFFARAAKPSDHFNCEYFHRLASNLLSKVTFIMEAIVKTKAPLLARVKSWQLVGLGLSGWCTLYSVALITWGAGSGMIGNTQGGCFAATMTLASFEAKRYRTRSSTPVDPLQWVSGVTTEHLNQTIAQVMQKREFRIEPSQPSDAEMGFGVRAVNTGRTMIFETSRWKEPVVDLLHAQTTEENRRKVLADLAIIVSVGKPDEAAKAFVKSRPLQFLVDQELKAMFNGEKPAVKKV